MRSLNDQLNNEELMLNLGQSRVRSNQNKKQTKGMESLTIYGEALCSFNVDIIVNHLRAIRRKIEGVPTNCAASTVTLLAGDRLELGGSVKIDTHVIQLESRI